MKRIGIWILFLPVQLLLILCIAAAELVRLLMTPFRQPETEVKAIGNRRCSLVVLNWNGRHLLEESLPAMVWAVEFDGRDHQILIVDNGSTDGSIDWLAAHYPGVDVISLPENLGFGQGNNRGVQEARHDIVILLNNDMIVSQDFLGPLLEGFDDPQVFAVSSQIELPEGKRREETGNTSGRFALGFLHVGHDPIRPHHFRRKYLPVLWPGGGASAFRKDLFLSLGGFSGLFDPCYFEDTDLGYRAWRRGWKVLLAAESRVLHKHRSSTSIRFSSAQLQVMIEERRLWYTWKNYQFRTLIGHFLLFPLNLTRWVPVGAYLRALVGLPRVLSERIREPKRRFKDRHILDWPRRPLLYLNHFQPNRSNRTVETGDRLRILALSAYLPHLGTHGGAGRVFQLLTRIASDHDVTLVSFVEGEQEEVFAEQARQFCRRVILVPRRRFLPLSPFPYEPFEEFNVQEFRESLEELLCEEDFDLVHFEWTQMGLYGNLINSMPRLLTEVEVNYAARRTLLDITSNPLKKARLYYETLQTLYREVEIGRCVDKVICVTEEDRGYLEPYLPGDHLEVINTGVDTGFFHFNLGGFEPGAILFVGAFRHSPNLDAMLYFTGQIYPKIQEWHPEAHLYVVGSSPPEEILELGQKPGVTVTGYVEDLREYYRRAQVVVVPLRTGVGIRGKILEGWAAGRATVATSLACQGIKAVHGDNILISDRGEDFARWTVALLRDPASCRRIGLRGRETVERFYEWDVLAGQLKSIYESVSARSGHASAERTRKST